jgi:transposase
MLSMDDIKYIKRMYEKEDCSIREIMRRTGYHYETVKKYCALQTFITRPLLGKKIYVEQF